LLRELLTNLVDNAVKYTPAGGHVTVRVRDAYKPAVEVEDDGIGIPIEERQSVFERFYRVLGTDAEGSGLGLPIAAEIAELHQASMELLSGRDGRGSLFRIEFPHDRTIAPPERPAVDPVTYPFGP
jgi:two-component system sensor histidine kinase TctE